MACDWAHTTFSPIPPTLTSTPSRASTNLARPLANLSRHYRVLCVSLSGLRDSPLKAGNVLLGGNVVMTLELLKHFVRKVLCTQVNYREYAGNFCPRCHQSQESELSRNAEPTAVSASAGQQ